MSAVKHSSVCILLLIFLLAVDNTWRVEGRYLPTRSDNSRQEYIKEFLRAFLDVNEGENPIKKQSYLYDDVLRSKRATFNHNAAMSLQA